jgi:hypothetical protein
MRKLLSISACLVLMLASFLAYFTHEHDLDASHTERHIVHSHFKLHFDVPDSMPDLGGRTGKMEGSEPPAHYLDIYWLQSNAPAVIPAFVSEDLNLITPSLPHAAILEPFEVTGWRGPPFEDHRIPRSPPSNSRL